MDALKRLGLLDLVMILMAHGGLRDFVSRNAPTYPYLVKEFLTTLEVRSSKDVRFKLRGRECYATNESIACAFGITRKSSRKWMTSISTTSTPMTMTKTRMTKTVIRMTKTDAPLVGMR